MPLSIKLSGIYLIHHSPTKKFYIGFSVNIWSRMAKHYTDLYLNKHHSPALQLVFNNCCITDFEVKILEYVSLTEFKKQTGYKGKKLEGAFRKYLTIRERYHMGLYSASFAFNQDNKYFKK